MQLVTLFILLNEYSEFNFKRVVKLSDTLKVSLGKLSTFSTIQFFSWLLLKKMQDKSLKAFKVVNIGPNMLFPVQVSEKGAKVDIEAGSPISWSPIGQELEQTYTKFFGIKREPKTIEDVQAKVGGDPEEDAWQHDLRYLIKID